MKFYNTELTLQNFGSAYLIILRGKLQDVKESFNSFFNWGGVSQNGSLDISESAEGAIGVFWTNDNYLRRYWLNRFTLLNADIPENTVYSVEFNGKGEPVYTVTSDLAVTYIGEQIALMRQDQEKFMTFDKTYFTDGYSMGKISAESPDLSFREAAHAHVSKQQQEAEV